jgi:HTH-type transcriptional regulator / antitoxin HipB
MPSYTVRTPEQLATLLQAFRKVAGLTQAQAAERMGVTQQTYSALERNAAQIGFTRLLKLLAVLEVQLVLQQDSPVSAQPVPSGAAGRPHRPRRPKAGSPTW